MANRSFPKTMLFVGALILAQAIAQTGFPLRLALNTAAAAVQPVSAALPARRPDGPLDDSTPLVRQSFTDWTVSQDFIYWAYRCTNSMRFNGYLRRTPKAGGTTDTLLSTTSSNCVNFEYLAADDVTFLGWPGVYYYDRDAGVIAMSTETFVGFWQPQTLPIYTISGDTPSGRLLVDSQYVYWLTTDNRVVRISKFGAASSLTLANTASSPGYMVQDDTNLYWLDDGGLWRVPKSCPSTPCPAQVPITSAIGKNLMVYTSSGCGSGCLAVNQSPATASYLYWVEFTNPMSIKRATINGGSVSTFYTAPAGVSANIGQLTTDGIWLYWPESLSQPVPNSGRIRRMPIGYGAVNDVASGLSNLDLALYTDGINVFYGQPSGLYPKISSYPTDPAALVRDFQIGFWEVTQAVQNLANDVPLVANKETVVRVYGRQLSGNNANAVGAYLYGTRNGSPLPGSPLYTTRAMITGNTDDRARLNDGWRFTLPDAWTNPGTISLQAVIDPMLRFNDPDRTNNSRTANFTFNYRAPVCLQFVPVRTNAPAASLGNTNAWDMVTRFSNLWPVKDVWVYEQSSDIAELATCWFGIFPYPCFTPYEIPEDNGKILLSLFLRTLTTNDPSACGDAGASTHWVGMVNGNTNTGSKTGFANYTLALSWVKFPPTMGNPVRDWTWPAAGDGLAQEVAHNENGYFGTQFLHVNCGGPADVNTNYPYPPCQIDNVGPFNHYGFNMTTYTPISPSAASDFMSYGAPRWVSDYTYRNLYNKIGTGQNARDPSATANWNEGAPNAVSSAPQLPVALTSTVVMVSGIVTDATNQGRLSYAWQYPAASLTGNLRSKWQQLAAPLSASTPATPSYHLQLRAPGGHLLDDRAFVPMLNDEHDQNVPHSQLFALTFPTPISAVARLDLMNGNGVLDSLQPGTHPPTVTVLLPAGGETIYDRMTVVWRASDADAGDHLLYTIQYSRDDGVTWQAIGTDFPGPPGSEVVTLTLASLGHLPGDTTTARIRVAASDGYNTTVAVSPHFTVVNQPPQPHIDTPPSGSAAPVNHVVTLSGQATDPEDGGLSGDALRWFVDGVLKGTDHRVDVEGLAPGLHVAEMKARDSALEERTASVTFTVEALDVPLSGGLRLDGNCDDPAYAAAPLIHLAPYTGTITDTTTAVVRTVHAGDALWVCFSGLHSGASDSYAGVRVDVDDSRDTLAQPNDYGFFVGHNGGTFTLAGDGAGGFGNPGPGGLYAHVKGDQTSWSAELRIDAGVLGGWGHRVGLDFGHYRASTVGDDHHWPYQSLANQPHTWAETRLSGISRLFMPVVKRS